MNNDLLITMFIVYIIAYYSNVGLFKTIYMKHKKTNIKLNKISVSDKTAKSDIKKYTYFGLIGNVGRTIYEYYQELPGEIKLNLN